MKHCYFHSYYPDFFLCCMNFKEALTIIGTHDPLNVKYHSLYKRPRRIIPTAQMNAHQLYSRGVLNVLKSLKRNLGKHGKYSITTIKKVSNVKYDKETGKVRVAFPCEPKAFVRIVYTIYCLLHIADSKSCDRLFRRAEGENILSADLRINKVFPAISPIHVDIIFNIDGEDKFHESYINCMVRIITEAQKYA